MRKSQILVLFRVRIFCLIVLIDELVIKQCPMNAYKVRSTLINLIKNEQTKLNTIESKLKKANPSFSDPIFLKLLSQASLHNNNISTYKTHLKKFSKRSLVKRAIVQAGSQVKLVSTKIGATIWVDATNYAELLGKQLGDTVLMHNSTFKIAGIY